MTQFTFNHPALDAAIEIGLDQLSESAVTFLLDYGIRQYLADGAAVALKNDEGNVRPLAERNEEKRVGIERRLDNVLTGDFTRTVSRDPFAVEFRRVAKELLTAAAKAQNKKLPTDKDERRAMLERFSDRNRERIAKIAERNIAARDELGTIDADLD